MEICTDYKKWVEEKIEEPIQIKKEGAREKCSKKKCKKWCACCNKWFCWIETFFYWIVEWIVKIIGKWLVYTICRLISAFITLLITIAFWIKWIYCNIPIEFWIKSLYYNISRKKSEYAISQKDENYFFNLDLLSIRTLRVEVIIIDKNKNTPNQITEQEIKDRISYADRILKDRAHIEVKKKGKIKRNISASLFTIDNSSFKGSLGEWFKALFLLLGRDSVRNLTVYAVGKIKGPYAHNALHLPIYGSVFIEPGTPDIVLCHEIGHALLSLANTSHVDDKNNLMFENQITTQNTIGWPANLPTLTQTQVCSMLRSRWLDWTWSCEKCQ